MSVVRHAKTEDLPAMCDLLAILFAQESEMAVDRAKQERGLRMILASSDMGQLLVLEDAGRVVGMISILWTISTALGGRSGWIEDVVVHPDHRGKGGGKLLLAAAITYAREQECLRLMLMTDRDNEVGQRMYAAYGFKASTMIVMRNLL